MKKVINTIIFYLFLFFSFLIIFVTGWLEKNFGSLNLDSLLFHIFVPLKGTANNMINTFLLDPLLKTFLIIIFFCGIFVFTKYYQVLIEIKFFKYKLKDFNLFTFVCKLKIIFVLIFFIFSIIYFCNHLKVFEYIKNTVSYSNFIEENYVDPKKTKIKFTEKRNLIYILAESMEFTYSDYKNGGAYEYNLIPHLTKYAKDDISFRTSNKGGVINTRATEWTVAAMVAQSSGIGFYVPVNGNDFGQYSTFLPGAYSLGDILEKEGYNQTLLIGSDADFAGRRDYYEQHGNYTIKDYNYAKEHGWIPEDYNVWWGYEDSKLFEFAKEELMELSKKSKPFNLTLLTTNTHHIGGYLEEDCDVKYEEQLQNVVLCSDKQIYDFVEWIKSQDFYKNTTIVIVGDHLSMEPEFFNDLEGYERTNYNVFINSYSKTKNINNRNFNTLDIYPTILSSMGANVDGNRLGLGTNLFSGKKTLYEEYGRDYVELELSKSSKYFKNKIIYGKES